MPLRLLSILLLGSILQADAVSDLKAALARLTAQEPVRASLDFQFRKKQGDEKKPTISEGRANTFVEDGPQGLKMFWSRTLLQAASQEARAQAKDPELPATTRQAMEGLNAVEIAGYLNGADELLRALEQGQLVEEKEEPWQGKVAKLLRFKLTPKLSIQNQKYVKEFESTVKIWIGSDGLPIAAESSSYLKGRAFLVVTFEQKEHETFEFLRAGSRLLVVHHIKETSGSGGGENGHTRKVVNLKLSSSTNP